ncbi:cytochrome c [Paucihalobacter ruber]|uniref:Cytochrome c n=1 Tax=Paucihalobacter ruber TaxID=2567861 RepID=A0A506PGF4_9FLAO|nr:cytochrome c [Paucihalobacter ruber]TPV32933.1 cytochrome c [Paucihalobacter ruber]
MRTLTILITFLVVTLVGCSEKEDKTRSRTAYAKKTTEAPAKKAEPASKRIDLTNKGIGPITDITLEDAINQDLAAHGADVYQKMCTACHKVEKKHIGPSPKGILERRTPEWVMNMILNPEQMVKEDQLAKDLLIEFNGSPMANQNLTEEDARAVLEYFRTL